jgi:uncharacterized protein (DUF2336 family)
MVDDRAIGLDTTFLEKVVAQGGVEARQLLVQQISLLLQDASTPLLEREQVYPVLTKLANDEEADVRRDLILALKEMSDLPPEVTLALAACDTDAALEFVRCSPSIDSRQMLAILKVGDGSRHVAIAGRPDVTAHIVDYLLDKGTADAVIAMLENLFVELTAPDYRRLYGRFALVPEVMDRLLAIADLPSDVRVMQARRVSGRMKQYLAEMPWTESGGSIDGIVESEDTTMIAILESCRSAETAGLAHFMSDKGLISPALILRACCLGHMRAVEIIMQHLTSYKRPQMRELMYEKQGSKLRSVFVKAGLPVNSYGLFVSACVVHSNAEVENYKLKPARFGRRLIEQLMTLDDSLSLQDRQTLIDVVARYADETMRPVARKLKASLLRAA